jgi:hypothetical protein
VAMFLGYRPGTSTSTIKQYLLGAAVRKTIHGSSPRSAEWCLQSGSCTCCNAVTTGHTAAAYLKTLVHTSAHTTMYTQPNTQPYRRLLSS